MENEQLENEQDARAALAAVDEARASAAGLLVTPWWYHVVLGLLVSGLVALLGLASLPVLLVGLVLYFVGLFGLVQAYKKKYGVWKSGLSGGKGTVVAYRLMGVYFAAAAVAAGFGRLTDLVWPVWLVVAVMFGATVVLGRQYDVALRDELRNAP
ncbi:hypothetical protein JOF48_002361 [Arthrobacter stackebrandtii]|uniref:ATP synthase subunit I n=1 Tax=Arthrobacter stackebrandtii TaxID=272161 RepID=A0ABS4YYP1_9MICC|nr:hypothetical protein [Arthrobacter stackebrandtii]MBP2413562.1 hypothetical protein [Arthrobacter stackebrandtii]PYH00609.1 hypothetical protein CVV67_08760 [Arthrobacter stackebrandtii]